MFSSSYWDPWQVPGLNPGKGEYLCNGLAVVLGRTTSVPKSALRYKSVFGDYHDTLGQPSR